MRFSYEKSHPASASRQRGGRAVIRLADAAL
jgi:hypothetical protein